MVDITFDGQVSSASLDVGSSTVIDAFINDATMATAGATNVPTSESVKSYIDASAATVGVGVANEMAYYALSGTSVSGLPTANDGLLVTSATGEPSIGNAILGDITVNSIKFGLGSGSVSSNICDWRDGVRSGNDWKRRACFGLRINEHRGI